MRKDVEDSTWHTIILTDRCTLIIKLFKINLTIKCSFDIWLVFTVIQDLLQLKEDECRLNFRWWFLQDRRVWNVSSIWLNLQLSITSLILCIIILLFWRLHLYRRDCCCCFDRWFRATELDMLTLRLVHEITRFFAIRQRKAFILTLSKKLSRIVKIIYDLFLKRRSRSFVSWTVDVESMIAIKYKIDVCLIQFVYFICFFEQTIFPFMKSLLCYSLRTFRFLFVCCLHDVTRCLSSCIKTQRNI